MTDSIVLADNELIDHALYNLEIFTDISIIYYLSILVNEY